MSDPQLPSVDKLAELVQARTRDQLPALRLRIAIELGRELSDTGDALIARFVAEARAAELSWTEIGQLFGTSKQAAQKRFAAAAAEQGRWPGRWAPAAHHVLNQAGEQARELGHNYVGTEHALLGLVLKQAIEHSQRIADGLGHRVTNTEHLLAGILAVPDALAVELLKRLGVSADDVRAELARRLDIDAQRLVVVTRRRRRRLLAKTS